MIRAALDRARRRFAQARRDRPASLRKRQKVPGRVGAAY